MPLDCWLTIKSGNPNPSASRGPGGAYAYDDFRRKTDEFAALLPGIVDSISAEAQKFYDQHFSQSDPVKVTLKLGVTTKPAAILATADNNREFSLIQSNVSF